MCVLVQGYGYISTMFLSCTFVIVSGTWKHEQSHTTANFATKDLSSTGTVPVGFIIVMGTGTHERNEAKLLWHKVIKCTWCCPTPLL